MYSLRQSRLGRIRAFNFCFHDESKRRKRLDWINKVVFFSKYAWLYDRRTQNKVTDFWLYHVLLISGKWMRPNFLFGMVYILYRTGSFRKTLLSFKIFFLLFVGMTMSNRMEFVIYTRKAYVLLTSEDCECFKIVDVWDSVEKSYRIFSMADTLICIPWKTSKLSIIRAALFLLPLKQIR
jgi:hypothetical protein